MPSWDKTVPATSDIVSDFPSDAKEYLLKPLSDAIGREHTFPGAYGTTAGIHTNLELEASAADPTAILREYGQTLPTSGFKLIVDQDDPRKLQLLGYTAAAAFLGLMELTQFSKAVTIAGEISGKMEEIFPQGVRLIFAQAAAPTGWTQVTSWNDKMIRIVDNSDSEDLSGSTGGDWDPTNLDAPLFEPGLSDSHLHEDTVIDFVPYTVADTSGIGSTYAVTTHDHTTITEDSDEIADHVHGITLDDSWRPAYLDVIIASRNA